MARPVADHVTRLSEPHAIEQALASLWQDRAQNTPVVRAIMSNLVIYRARPRDERVEVQTPFEELPIADVVRRHPARVIVLMHTDDVDELQAPVGASVGLLVFETDGQQHAVEHITIRSSCAEASLPSIVRGLTLGDLPTSVWWTDDLSQSAPLAALVTIGRQFVYDSRQWRDVRAGLLTVASLAQRPDAPDFSDLNWRRLEPMRRALDGTLARLAAGMPRMRATVRHRASDAAAGWLLAGWLASRDRDSGAEIATTVQAGGVRAGPLSVTIASSRGPLLTASMNDAEVAVTDAGGGIPLTIAQPAEGTAEQLAAELLMLGRDVPLLDAVRAAATRVATEASP